MHEDENKDTLTQNLTLLYYGYEDPFQVFKIGVAKSVCSQNLSALWNTMKRDGQP